MSITNTIVFTAADGSQFATRKEAQAYQDKADRKARLIAAGFDAEFAEDAADKAAEVIAALTLPSRMGRKPKTEAGAA